MSQVIETLRMTESTLRSSKIDFTFVVAPGAASPKNDSQQAVYEQEE